MHHLIYESLTVLRALLIVAVSPYWTSTVPLCHSAHSSYLLDLRALWTNHGQDDRQFLSVLTEVLLDFGGDESWTCKAMTRLAFEVRGKDFVHFIGFASGLAQVIHNMEAQSGLKRRKTCPRDRVALEEQLAKWLNVISSYPFDIPTWNNDRDQEYMPTVLTFLAQAKGFGMHKRTTDDSCLRPALSHAIVSIATDCLSRAQNHPAILGYDLEVLKDILLEAIPTTSTYNNLITSIFNHIPHNSSYPQLEDCKRLLHIQASTLRTGNFLHLEASLWACALRHVEQSDGDTLAIVHGSAREVQSLRSELIELVEEAERRYFGLGLGCLGARQIGKSQHSQVGDNLTPTQTKRCHLLNVIEPQGEWEWEELVGCWVRRTEMSTTATRIKKFKAGDDLTLRKKHPLSKRLDNQSPRSGAEPLLFDVPFRRSSTTPSLLDSITDPEDDVTPIWCSSSPLGPLTAKPKPKLKTKIPFRISNFSSILADSLNNRFVLHPKCPGKATVATSGTVGYSYPPASTPDRPHHSDENLRIQCSTCPADSIPELDSLHLFPSDDSMDLFAYGSSPLLPVL